MRLVAFGCSITYGHGLYDCWDPSGTINTLTPSKLAWPNKLAELLGVEVINKGSCGASNKEISWNIQNFDFDEDDIVVIAWSYIQRYCTIQSEKHIEQYGPWRVKTEKSSKVFFKQIWNEYDAKIDLHTRINYINSMLDKQNIKNFHAYARDDYKLEVKWHTTQMLKSTMTSLRRNYPNALDNLHPGEEAQLAYAKKIHNEIKELI